MGGDPGNSSEGGGTRGLEGKGTLVNLEIRKKPAAVSQGKEAGAFTLLFWKWLLSASGHLLSRLALRVAKQDKQAESASSNTESHSSKCLYVADFLPKVRGNRGDLHLSEHVHFK